jgi:hypothetical protein
MIDWKDFDCAPLGFRFDASVDSIGLGPLFKKILETGSGTLTKLYKEGYSDTAFDFLQKRIAELNGKKIYENNTKDIHFIYRWDDAFLDLIYSKAKYISIHLASCNDAVSEMCKNAITMFSINPKKGYVFAITKSSGGSLVITRIGYAGTPLERGNYTEDVCKDYDYIVEDLKSKDPSGRIIILDGEAGTGKTFLTKGILMDVPKAMFVIVPPTMVSSIGGPELLPLLLRTKEDYSKKGPVVLILEDADQCLAPRAADNMSSISSILNLGDGIFGSLFDIRIIATTNAKAKDIDKAITRDMRLSKRISVQAVPYKNANAIYQRILKDNTKELPIPVVDRSMMRPTNEKTTFTLAEIYKAARNTGWKPIVAETEEIASEDRLEEKPEFSIEDLEDNLYEEQNE